MTDLNTLVYRCQQGDLAAFSELFHAYEGRIYRLAATILQNEQDAEDAVQDVFLRLFEHIKGFNGQSSFNTWITAVTVNTCRDKLRRQKVRQAFSLEWLRGRGASQDIANEVAKRQERQTLWAHINQLEEKYRLPLILHYHERLPCEEVANILGIKTAVVYSRLNTARLKLREMLQKQTMGDWKLEIDNRKS